ncbi:MAG: Asp23/Gls24 family envelope stress response protein, partial [Methylococcales bacterium]|nr:Asp23/Gls24 family envelope stress response protein [Methylococcales bacterium]
ADIPSSVDRRRRRRLLHDGILLEIDDRQAVFDLYVVTNADFNAVKVGESLQANIVEAIDKMVGTPVAAVNVHVQDIATAPDVQAD